MGGPPVPGPVVLAALQLWCTPSWHRAGRIWPDGGFSAPPWSRWLGYWLPEHPAPLRDLGLPREMARGQPGQVAQGGWLVDITRQVGTAVSTVWQCHLAVTAAARESRTWEALCLSLPPGGEQHLAQERGTRPLP